MILQKPPKHGLGHFIPMMWARQAGKRIAQERAWADTVEFYSWDRTKRSRWHLYVTRLKVRWGMLRLALARWIAGNQWPDPW